MAIQLGSAFGKIIIDASGVKKGIDEATGSLVDMSGKIVAAGQTMKTLGERFRDLDTWVRNNKELIRGFGQVVQDAGTRMMQFISIPILGFFALIIKKALDANTAMGNLGKESIERLNTSLAKLGEKFLPLFIKIVDGITAIIDAFLNAPPETQTFITKLVIGLGILLPIAVKLAGWLIQLATFLGGFGISAGTVSTFITGTLIPAVVGIGASIASVALPIIAIIATLALLYWAFKNNWMGITDTVKQAWFLLGYYIAQMVDKVKNFFKNINWEALGKNLLQGFANGMLGGIPAIVTAAIKAGGEALAAIRKSLGIASPSKEFMKLGAFSGQGFQAGLMNAMDPNLIAHTMAKPVQNVSNSQQQNINFQFAGGLTMRQAQGMIAENNELLMKRMTQALGGA